MRLERTSVECHEPSLAIVHLHRMWREADLIGVSGDDFLMETRERVLI